MGVWQAHVYFFMRIHLWQRAAARVVRRMVLI